MSYLDKINDDIKAAMRAKEREKLEALRAVKTAFTLAQTSGEEVTEATHVGILKKLVKQRKDSAALYAEQNRPELAEKELAEAAIIEAYLPAQMSEEEVTKMVQEIIAQTGAAGMKDMGKVMGMATQKAAGNADNKLVSQIVKSLLQ